MARPNQASKNTEYERRLEMLQKRADYNKFSGISRLDRSKSSKKNENMKLAKERKKRHSRNRFSNIYTTAHESWANAPEFDFDEDDDDDDRGNIFMDDSSFYASDIDSSQLETTSSTVLPDLMMN